MTDDDRSPFDAADAVWSDVMDTWGRRAQDESRTPRERLAWAEAEMDLRSSLSREGYLRHRATPEELERIERQHAAKLKVGDEFEMYDGVRVRVTEWGAPYCGFAFAPVDSGEFRDGVARMSCAPDPGLEDRFAEIMTIDGDGEQMLPDDENPGTLVSLRELVRRQYLAMES